MGFQVLHPGNGFPTDQPKVTFWIQCYNHEHYVVESVRSALQQSYPAMEVFISDDCSTDTTFSVLHQAVAGYSGPHRLVLFQPERNLGNLAHFNRGLRLVSGDIVIWQSSDDVALPERAALLSAELASGSASFTFSNHFRIDAKGDPLGIHLPSDASPTLTLEDFSAGRNFDFTFGGTIGFKTCAVRALGPIPTHNEPAGLEHYLALAGALEDGCRYLPQLLLRKRLHSTSWTPGFSDVDRQRPPRQVCIRKLKKRARILATLNVLVTQNRQFGNGPRLEDLSLSLLRQIECTTDHLMQIEGEPDEIHPLPDGRSGPGPASPPDPFSLHLVSSTESGFNILAHECLFFAVPQGLGPIEPCRLRNGCYDGVIRASSLPSLLRKLGGPQ